MNPRHRSTSFTPTSRPLATLRLTAVLLASVLTQGCSIVEGYFSTAPVALDAAPKREESAPQPVSDSTQNSVTRSVGVEELQRRERVNDVEIFWEVPNVVVDGFIIQYGFDDHNLEFEREVMASDLEVREEPNRGKVYRYLLAGVPKKKDLYFSLTSVRSGTRSEPSPVFRLDTD